MVISFIYFAVGAFALIAQAVLLREFFVVVHGNEYIVAVLLTHWFIGIFAGAWVGAAAARKITDHVEVFVFSLIVLAILLPVDILFIRFLYFISGTEPGMYIGFLQVFSFSALAIIPVGFFIGFAFPAAARVSESVRRVSSSIPGKIESISSIYIFEGFGSLLGGVVYTFLLAGRVSSFLVAAIFGLFLLMPVFVLLRRTPRTVFRFFTGIMLVLQVVMLLPFIHHTVERFTVRERWRSMSALPLVYCTQSPYQDIALTELTGQFNLYGNAMLSAVFPNDQDNRVLAAHLMCQHPSPGRILIIGEAVSGLAKYLLEYNVEKIDSVEMDGKIIETVLKFLPAEDRKALEDKRFSMITGDGREYVKDLIRELGDPDCAVGYDIVYLNIPEPSTLLLNRYYTAEFSRDLGKILRPGGVVALKVTSSENYEKGVVTDYTASIYHTVKSRFPVVVVMPGVQNFLFASTSKTSVSDDPDILKKRYEATGVKPARLGILFRSLYPVEQTGFIKKALEEWGIKKINKDEKPIGSLYYNKILGWYNKSVLPSVLEKFEGLRVWVVVAFILVLFGSRLVYVYVWIRKKKKNGEGGCRFHVYLAVLACGFAGLSLELVILYLFQGKFGNIYQVVGFIIALFMLGLPIGAGIANRLSARVTHGNPGRKAIAVIMFFLSFLCVLVPLSGKLDISSVWISQLLFFLEIVLTGFGVGMAFPFFLRLYMSEVEVEGEPGKAAGIINGYDHIGAALGAFLMGTFLVPVVGVFPSCIVLALVLVLSALLLVQPRGGAFAVPGDIAKEAAGWRGAP